MLFADVPWAWQVGQLKPSEVGELHYPDVGLQCSEGVAGDLGASAGYRLEQGALTSVREADKTNISDQLEVELDRPSLASEATVLGVSGSPGASPGHEDAVILPHQVAEYLSTVSHHSDTQGGPDDDVLPVLSHALHVPEHITM